MRNQTFEADTLITRAEVAVLLAVDRKTVTRWATAGKLSWVQTPGRHRRYLKSEIVALATAASCLDQARTPTLGHQAAAGPADPQTDVEGSARSGLAATSTGEQPGEAAVAHGMVTAREAEDARPAPAVLFDDDAVRAATTLVARAAEQARVRRSVAAAATAQAEVINAREAAATVQRQVELTAARWQTVADGAAEIVAAASAPGGDRKIALAALRLATTIQAAAAAARQDAAAAAAGVAADVAVAVKQAARAVAEVDTAIEVEVMQAAVKLRTAADAAVRRLDV